MKPRPQRGQLLAQADDGTAKLYIYDQIGADFFSEGVTAKQVVAAVAECEKSGAKRLEVYIKSPGGDVFEGMAILACLKRFSGKTCVYVDGLAASIASVIAMAGTEIRMGSGAMMMIHDPRALPTPMGVGTADQMREKAAMLDKVADAMVGAYRERTKGDADEIRDLMRAETWMTASECVERGFADETFQQDEDARASAAAFTESPIFASFRNVPAILLARAEKPHAGAPGGNPTKESANMKALLAKLGLSESATEAQAVTAVEALIVPRTKLTELTGATTEAEALGTIHAWKASHSKVAELSAEVAKLAAAKAEAEVVPLVDQAIRDGKAAPAQRESLLAMGKASPETLKAFVAAAPVIHGKSPLAPKAETDSTTLTPEDQEVCKKMNIDPKKFLESKTKAIAEGRAPNAGALALLSMAAA